MSETHSAFCTLSKLRLSQIVNWASRLPSFNLTTLFFFKDKIKLIEENKNIISTYLSIPCIYRLSTVAI